MMPYLHHIEKDEAHLDGVTTCGFTAWQWVTTEWDRVTCPHCLALKAALDHKPAQPREG